MAKKQTSRCLRAVVSVWVSLAMALSAGPVQAFGLSGAEEQMGDEAIKKESPAGQSSPDAAAGASDVPVPQVVEDGEMGLESLPDSEKSTDQPTSQPANQPDPANDAELSVSSEQPASADEEMKESADELKDQNGEDVVLATEANLNNATAITIGETRNSYLYTGSSDVYRFYLSNASRVRLVSSTSFSSAHFELFDADGKRLWNRYADWNSNVGTGSLNELVDLTKGVYYVSLSSYNNKTGSYSLKLTSASANVSFEEGRGGSNNTIPQAQKISLGTSYRGQLALNDSADVYKVWFPKAGRLRLTSRLNFSSVRFELFNADGERLWSEYADWNSNTSTGSLNETVDLGGGSYYVSVSSYNNNTGNYSLNLGYSFPDVASNHWASNVISRAVGLSLMSGYRDGRFGPNNKITRAQVATVLWNMAGRPGAGSGGKYFPDVKSGTYYYTAVRWASSRGVVSGYGNGTFGPARNVTREELAVMLANYAKYIKGRSVSGSISDFSNMSDRWSVSTWARPAVGWCFRNKILSGSGGRVNAKGSATRAEASKMVVMLKDRVG